MARAWLCALLLAAGMMTAVGQEDTFSFDDLVQGAQEWAEENLDENVLAALREGDRERIQELFAQLEKEWKDLVLIEKGLQCSERGEPLPVCKRPTKMPVKDLANLCKEMCR